jgi:hypothetical protein
LAIRYWTRGVAAWKNFKDEDDKEIDIDTPIAKGAPFRIDIDILLAGYTIGIGEKTTIQIDLNKDTSMLPPWSADHIFVSKHTAINHGEKIYLINNEDFN